MRKTLAIALLTVVFTFAGVIALNPPAVQAQQNTLTMTSLSADVTAGANTVVVGSATGITVSNNTTATILYVDKEEMVVLAVNGTQITVSRGQGGTPAAGHRNHAMVLAGNPTYFFNHDPQGSCTTTSTLVTPYVNVISGNQWLCSTITKTWVPGFGNPGTSGTPISVTTAVASVGGATLPSGPLFHVTGTNAITSWTQPVGCNATVAGGCSFVTIPDAAFTWAGGGNMAATGTAVANLPIIWTWDATNSKWVALQSK